MILGWFENCTKDEIPPEYLWEDSDGLDKWWATVREKRETGFGGGSSNSYDSDDSSEMGERDQGPGTAENDLARAFKDG